jgi:RNA polymerase sigma-70 factor (ECF subfamily)
MPTFHEDSPAEAGECIRWRGTSQCILGAAFAAQPTVGTLVALVALPTYDAGARKVRPRMPDEDRLIARAAAGDTAAFRELYERHRTDVARLVYRMLGNRSDFEDVIQEVFVQVYRSLKDFRGQAKFSTWLHRVTVNVVLMHRRSARSRPVFADEPPGDGLLRSDDVRPDDDAERRERVRAFGRLLARLADKKRIVFVLHELEGIAPGEIARMVGAPVLTVRTRLFYARRELEAMLSEEPSLAGLETGFSKGGRLEEDA